jgi:purine-cytosine permease-like protein
MILMPMGAIIFIDFWVIRKFGLQSNYAEQSKKNFNLAAGLAWIVTVSICSWLVLTGRIQIFFVSLPGWFFTAVLYIVLSFFYQKKARPQIKDKE